jgi:hypothetical protein
MNFSLTGEVKPLIVLSLAKYGFDKENVHYIRELLFNEKESLIQVPFYKAFV